MWKKFQTMTEICICGNQLRNTILGRATAQAVSRWLPTVATQVRIQAEHVGFVVDEAALGQVFSKYLGFP
jgi:hypothetical protein